MEESRAMRDGTAAGSGIGLRWQGTCIGGKGQRPRLCQKAKELGRMSTTLPRIPLCGTEDSQWFWRVTVLQTLCLLLCASVSLESHSSVSCPLFCPWQFNLYWCVQRPYDSQLLNLHGAAVFPSYWNKITSFFVSPSFLLNGSSKSTNEI